MIRESKYGLKRRPTFEELENYLLHHQEILKLPKRIKYRSFLDEYFNHEEEEEEPPRENKEIQTDTIEVTDKTTQTDFPEDKGTQTSDDEDYRKFYDGTWWIYPAHAQNFNYWFNRVKKDKKTQTDRFLKLLPAAGHGDDDDDGDDDVNKRANLFYIFKNLFPKKPDETHTEVIIPAAEDEEEAPHIPTPPPQPQEEEEDYHHPEASSSTGYQTNPYILAGRRRKQKTKEEKQEKPWRKK